MKIYRQIYQGGNTTPTSSWESTPYTNDGLEWISGYKVYANGGVYLYRRQVGGATASILGSLVPMMPFPVETYFSKDVDITIGYLSCLDEVLGTDFWRSDDLLSITADTVFFDNDDLQKNPLAKAIEDGVFSADGTTAGDISEMEIRMTFFGQMANQPIPGHKEIGWLKGWSIVNTGDDKALVLAINTDLEAFVSTSNGSLKTGRYSLCIDENGLHEDIVNDGVSTNISGRLVALGIITDPFCASFDLDVSDVLEEEDPDDDIDYPDDDIIEDPVPSPFRGVADPDDIYRIEKVDVREPFNPVDCCMHIQRETPLTFPVVDVTPGRKVYYALAPDCTPLVALKNRRQGYAAADIISGKPSHAALRAAKGQREGAWFLFTPFRNLKPDESSNETE